MPEFKLDKLSFAHMKSPYSQICIDISNDTNLIVTSDLDNLTIVYQFKTKKILQTFEDFLMTVKFSFDGNHIIGLLPDNSNIKIWSIQSGQLLKTFNYGYPHDQCLCISGFCVDVMSDFRYVVAGGTSNSWSLIKMQPTNERPNNDYSLAFESGMNYISAVMFTKDNTQFVTGSSDNTVKLWDIQPGKLVQLFNGHSDSVNCITISKNDNYILSGSEDKRVIVWNRSTGIKFKTYEGHTEGVTDVAVSSDDSFVITASYDKTVKIFNFAKSNVVHTLTGHKRSGVRSISLSSDDMLLFTNSWHSIKIKDLSLLPNIPGMTWKIIRPFALVRYIVMKEDVNNKKENSPFTECLQLDGSYRHILKFLYKSNAVRSLAPVTSATKQEKKKRILY